MKIGAVSQTLVILLRDMQYFPFFVKPFKLGLGHCSINLSFYFFCAENLKNVDLKCLRSSRQIKSTSNVLHFYKSNLVIYWDPTHLFLNEQSCQYCRSLTHKWSFWAKHILIWCVDRHFFNSVFFIGDCTVYDFLLIYYPLHNLCHFADNRLDRCASCSVISMEQSSNTY